MPDGCENGDIDNFSEEQSTITFLIRREKLLIVASNGGKWWPSYSRCFSIQSRFFPLDRFLFYVSDGRHEFVKSKDTTLPPLENFLGYFTRSSSQNSRFLGHENKRKESRPIASDRESWYARIMRDSRFWTVRIDKDLRQIFKDRPEDARDASHIIRMFPDISVLFEFLVGSRFSPVAAHRRVAFFSNNELKEKKKKKKKNLLWSVHGAMIIIIIIIIEITMLRYMIKMII